MKVYRCACAIRIPNETCLPIITLHSIHLIVILVNTSVTAALAVALAVTLGALDQVRDPASNAFGPLVRFRLRVLGLATLDRYRRRVDIEARNGIVRANAAADVQRWHWRAVAAEKRFRLCERSGRGHLRRGIAENTVHILQTDIGRLGVDEPNC